MQLSTSIFLLKLFPKAVPGQYKWQPKSPECVGKALLGHPKSIQKIALRNATFQVYLDQMRIIVQQILEMVKKGIKNIIDIKKQNTNKAGTKASLITPRGYSQQP